VLIVDADVVFRLYDVARGSLRDLQRLGPLSGNVWGG
jgi:hypothetical protein